jgi:HEAT repeat protein
MIHGPAGEGGAPRPVTELRFYGRSRAGSGSRVVAVASTAPEPAGAAGGGEAGGPVASAEAARLAAEIARAEEDARLAAVRALAVRRDADAVSALSLLLAEDPAPGVQRAAIEALHGIGGEAMVPALEAGLSGDDASVRHAAVDAIGSIGGERALLDLGQVVFGDPEPEVRRLAVDYLAGDPGEPARAFLEAAAEDADPEVREAARGALGL